jgi:hypothetical protein
MRGCSPSDAASVSTCTITAMNDAKLFKLAKAGDLEALVDATAGDEIDDDEANEDAYKWLQIAADFGAKRARAMADELVEATSHGYDDGGLVVALILSIGTT